MHAGEDMQDKIKIGKREFPLHGHTYVMGILNTTPDSFSDGGKYQWMDAALKRTEQMLAEGADIIDIGGESTRPGYQPITEAEEIDRTAPLIAELKSRFDVPLSIDTYKSRVAAAAVEAGADLVNDIWGLKYDAGMAALIQRTGVSCCLMHNRGDAPYQHLIAEMKSDFCDSLALAAGIAKDKIILDPGVGFAKTYQQNLEIIRSLQEFRDLGYPLLLGASRKSVIGQTLGAAAEERLTGTLVTTVYAVMQQCLFVRVHDIKENVQAIRMAEALGGIAKGGTDG